MGKIRFSITGLNLRYPYPVCKNEIIFKIRLGNVEKIPTQWSAPMNSHKMFCVYVAADSRSIRPTTAENEQSMKPVQFCTGFIFCSFSANLTPI